MAYTFDIRESRMSNNTTASIKESWHRFWLPLENWDAEPRIGEDFLSPDGEPFASHWFSRQRVDGIQSLETYASYPFLLLLGRPGSGKTEELERAQVEKTLGKSILITGKEIGEFDPGEKIQQLIEAYFPDPADRDGVRILLDGLDEVLLTNKNFVSNLKFWMRVHKTASGQPKYNLAISTRWANWPETAVKELAELWLQQDFHKLVLAPLKSNEVFQTLKNRFGEIAANQFWHQMTTRRLQSVACWPQGLLGLMNGFAASGQEKLPQSYSEAIGHQVSSLCALTDNPDDSHRWSTSIDGKEWRQRLAGRLAATMFFSGRQKLSLQLTPPSATDLLCVTDITHTDEIWNESLKHIEHADVDRLVQHTGLLKRLSSKPHWVFQSHVYQEWLAADWLHQQTQDLQKLQSLFGHISEGTWKVYNELQAVACWLATRDVGFRQLLLNNDPLVLLGMDAGTLPESEREKVAEAILKATHEVRAIDHNQVEQSHIGSFSHTNLKTQLLSWLDNPAVHEAAKELAVEIAQHADLHSIVPHLWELLPHSAGRYRIELAHALSKLATDQNSIPRWEAVLDHELPLDDNGDLLGSALDHLVLGKKHLPLRNVLSSIFPEHDFGVIGVYRVVCLRLHEAMTPDDVPAVLTSLKEAKISEQFEEFYVVDNFCRRALELALENIRRPEIAGALADFWHHCLKRYLFLHEMVDLKYLFAPSLKAQEHRRRLINILINHPAFDVQQASKHFPSRHYLFVEEDLEWCLDEILMAQNPDDAWRYALAVKDFTWTTHIREPLGEKFDQACARSPFLRSILVTPEPEKSIRETMAAIADLQQKKHDAENAERENRFRQKQAASRQRLSEHEKACLQHHELGQLVWPDILNLLGERKHSQRSFTVTLGIEDEVRDNEEWIRVAARRYLVERPHQSSIEEENGIYPFFALAVVPTELQSAGPLQDSVRSHWLPVLIRSMTESSLEKASVGLTRARLAELFPADFAQAFGRIMRSRYQQGGSLSELREFLDFWSPVMSEELTQILTEEELQPTSFPAAIKYLFKASSAAALQVAKSWLLKIQDLEDKPRAALLGACMLHFEGRLTEEIQPLLNSPVQAAKALVMILGSLDYRERRMDVSAWSDQTLKTLANIVWIAFPKWDKHRSSGWSSLGGVGPHELAVEFRNHITHVSRDRGLEIIIPRPQEEDQSEDAQELESFADWHKHLTERKLSGAGWQPNSPEVFLKCVNTPHARLAKNNDELQAAVIDSLKRWEAQLLGGQWPRLWDEGSQKAKSEDRISDEMREWLMDDLGKVSVEREVKLLQNTRTDVLVQVPSPNHNSPHLALVIEVKKVRAGNNRERLTAASSQLLNRYLIPRQHEGWTHGLFLVAWTPSPGSDLDTEVAKNEEADVLSKQAVQLTKDFFSIKSMVLDARFGGSASSANPKKKSRRSSPKSQLDG